MSDAYAQIYIHLVFSTKERRPFLDDPKLRDAVFAYIAGGCRKLDCEPVIVGGAPDHVHVLCSLARTRSAAELARELKRASSKWIKAGHPELGDFRWQTGYGAFSVSPSHLPGVRRYIAGQAEHHEKVSFKEELLRILKKYGVEYDERYLWG